MLMKVRAPLIPPDAETLSALVGSITDCAIFLLDSAGVVASWNPGCERIKGYRADEIIGKAYAVFFTPEERALGMPAEALRAARSDGQFRCEGWRLRKDGSRFWASTMLTALKHPEGGLRGYLKVTQDISERRRTAERLRESDSRFQAFMSASPSVMFIKDLDGHYLHVNEKFLQRFGLRRDLVIGRTDLALFPRAQAERFIENDACVFARGAPLEIEETARYADAEHISIVSKFPIRDGQGNIVAIGGIATDITERKQMERELSESAEQLREISNRLVEVQESERRRLAQELHDRVGQNLTALNINLNVLLGQLPAEAASTAGLRVRLTDSLKLIEETAHCIEDVMSDLHPPMLGGFGLFATLRWYAALFEKRTAIAVAVNGEESVPRLSTKREAAMFRIAQGSMDNVAKHAQASRIDIDLRSAPGFTVMTVADNGVGFEPALLERPLQQPRWGMMSMRERARAIGGQLRVESAPGRGARIIVELERREPAAK